MAFSQAQKTFINLLTSKPYEAFNKIINGEIYLDTYQDEFFKDGTGLLHILCDGFCQDPELYYPIIQFVLNDKHLTLSDKAKGKNGASLVLIDYYYSLFPHGSVAHLEQGETPYYNDKSKQFLSYYCEIIKTNENIFSSQHKVDILSVLKLINEDMYKQFLPYVSLDKNNYQNLIRALILQDDKNEFEKIITMNKEIVSNFSYFGFFGKQRHNNEESNILTYALYLGAKDISSYIIDHNLSSLNGVCVGKKYSDYPKDKYIVIDTLTQALLSNDLDNYKKIFFKLEKEKFIPIFTNKHYVPINRSSIFTYDKDNLVHWDLLLQEDKKDFYDFVLSNKKQFINNDNTKDSKKLLDLLFATVSYEKNLEVVKNTLIHLLKESNIGGEIFNPPPLTNRLISVFKSKIKENMVQEKDYILLKDCIKILSQADLLYFDSHMVYDKVYFTHQKLFFTLKEAGIDFNLNYHLGKGENSSYGKPHNIIETYLKNNEINNFSTFTMIDSSDKYKFEKDLSEHNTIMSYILEHIGKNFYFQNQVSSYNLHFNSDDKTNIIGTALKTQNYDFLNLLNQEQIKKLCNGYIDFSYFIIEPFNEKKKIELEQFLNTCIDCDLSFFSSDTLHSHPFYQLLNKKIDFNILDRILEKENRTILELSSNFDFWENISNKYISQYVFDRGANYSHKNIALELGLRDKHLSLKFYLEYGGNVSYIDDKGRNILHILLRDNKIESGQIIFDHEPTLSEKVDKSHKFAVSYILQNYDKMCKNKYMVQSSNEIKKYQNYGNLIQDIFCEGLDSSQIKAMNFVEEQLKKYTNITNDKPEMLEYLAYGKLDKKVKKIEIQKKKKKI